MPTNLETELEANKCWRIKSKGNTPRFDELLLSNEFLSPELQQQYQAQALRKVLQHCYDVVPYYRQLFQDQKISRRHLRDSTILNEIPILEKGEVEKHAQKLQTDHLWPGHKQAGTTQSSGTTGQPTVVQHSDFSLGMFRWLKQRELRWYRYDPLAAMLSIRPKIELPRMPDGSLIPDGTYLKLAAWPYLGGLFETGPAWAFNNTNPVREQVQTLEKIKPNYLLMQSSCLEYLSMQEISAETVDSLVGVHAISQTLTPAMREQIEKIFRVPLHQNYGLNEIGLVASRCEEGGRYHVHSEQCLVEIVRDDGTPCSPGENGRLLVTSLTNPAMPLLRYDADDLAEATSGPCPCGRTLPSFGRIYGRYRRTAYLPEGTFQRWAAIQLAIYKLTANDRSVVSKYQAYQDAQGDFQLRINCEKASFESISRAVRTEFEQAYTSTTGPLLEISKTDQFLGDQGRKFQNFISEFTPDMD